MTSAGKWFYGFLQSDTLNTATDIPLFDANGNAVTLATGDRPVITDIMLGNGATACKISVFQDMDNGGTVTSGDPVFAAPLPVNGSLVANLSSELRGRVATSALLGKLKAIGSAASVGCVVHIIGKIITP